MQADIQFAFSKIPSIIVQDVSSGSGGKYTQYLNTDKKVTSKLMPPTDH